MWSRQQTERHLLQIVCNEQIPVTYGSLYALAGVDGEDIGSRNRFHHLLGEISADHVARNLPMLSVIVTTQEGLPGHGFFNFARELKPQYVGVDDLEIFVREFRAVQASIEIYRKMLG